MKKKQEPTDWKGRGKIVIIHNNMTVNVENLKVPSKRLKNEFSKG